MNAPELSADERNRILQHSAGLIFALQEFLPVDDYTSYDAQTAQEGLMRIHNSNHIPYERDALVHTLETEVDDLQNECDEANDRIVDLEERLEHYTEANKELEKENSKMFAVNSELQDKLDERYEADELLKKYAEMEETAKDLQKELKREKERADRYYRLEEIDRNVLSWKKKYVGRNGRCLFCGKDRYNSKRDKYGYCPLLRDCFTCEECGDARYSKSYNTFNGEHKSIGEIIFEKHRRGTEHELDSDVRYEVDITLRTYDERYVSCALIDGDFSQVETADIIEDWFKESISADRPKEIMKLLSHYRDRLEIGDYTHL
jgi:hypothetical protein